MKEEKRQERGRQEGSEDRRWGNSVHTHRGAVVCMRERGRKTTTTCTGIGRWQAHGGKGAAWCGVAAGSSHGLGSIPFNSIVPAGVCRSGGERTWGL